MVDIPEVLKDLLKVLSRKFYIFGTERGKKGKDGRVPRRALRHKSHSRRFHHRLERFPIRILGILRMEADCNVKLAPI